MAEEPGTAVTEGGTKEGVADDSTVITDGVKTGEALRSVQEAGEDKVAADKAAEEKAAEEKAAEEKDEGAPETYEDFKVPEGAKIDAEVLTKFHTLAKKFNLPQEGAQELIDLQAEFLADQNTQNVATWAKMRADWLEESKADKEIGGQQFDEKVEFSKRALRKFGTPKLVELLETYGLGNHPEIIRFNSRIGKDIGEDDITSGGSGSQGKTLAQRIFTQPMAQ